ncbi:DUF937 domain-containing protein [Algoriphagus sp. A40]|uniref:DUF937 domain-containing protein n=1 Tax=Algoriphagus sp. A40 TaxID=1945863 RepID=UPI0009877CA9|nr:DUF937 domain-containing protein [Algoriphagus sp. A40]OOG71116.1 hypothetical protein B0E43_17510 [Algoriphagus sp. A40]
MLDKLLKLADGPLQEMLAKSGGNPDSAVAVKESFLEVIQNQASSGNFEGVMEMFSGNETLPDSPAVNHMTGDLTNGLSQKLGIDSQKAMSIAAAALPMLLNLFNKQVNDAPQANEDIMNSVVKSMKGGGGSGLDDLLGSVFGGDKGKGGFDLGGIIDIGKGLFK